MLTTRLLYDDLIPVESFDLTCNNHLYMGRWRYFQEKRDFAPIVKSIHLFWLHYCVAAGPLLFPDMACFSDGTGRERFFSRMERDEASDLVDSVDKIREMLAFRLARYETGAFQVFRGDDEVVLALDDRKLSWLKRWEARFSKQNFDERVAPVLPKMAELLGALFSTQEVIKERFTFFGRRESVEKVVFEWNRVTLLRPLFKSEKLSSEFMGHLLCRLQESGVLCDMQLRAGGKRVMVHKLVFYQKKCEHLLTPQEFELNIAEEILDDFVDFLYLDLNDFVDKMRFYDKESHLPMLIDMASRYKIPLLMSCCIALLNLFASVEKVNEWKETYLSYNINDIDAIIRCLEAQGKKTL